MRALAYHQCSHPTEKSRGEVRGYLLTQIRGSKSDAVVQALSSHQCSHPTAKRSRKGGGGEGLYA